MTNLNPHSKEMLQQAIERFWETIPPVWGRIKGNVRGIATQNFDISVEQFHVLRHIRRGIGSVSELADKRQISRSAVSQSVDSLVEKNLITRTQSADDRRYVQLALTPAGETLLNTIFQKNRAWMMEEMEKAELSPDDICTLIQGMEVLKKAFNSSEA